MVVGPFVLGVSRKADSSWPTSSVTEGCTRTQPPRGSTKEMLTKDHHQCGFEPVILSLERRPRRRDISQSRSRTCSLLPRCMVHLRPVIFRSSSFSKIQRCIIFRQVTPRSEKMLFAEQLASPSSKTSPSSPPSYSSSCIPASIFSSILDPTFCSRRFVKKFPNSDNFFLPAIPESPDLGDQPTLLPCGNLCPRSSHHVCDASLHLPL
ncbi:hypothetical protein IE53DRAFT_161033 [Violaceomyces palustris]|uniref:Uncharacterized protein n=1 Tax=Violaceomyces palustris TaxID=1673888 RepID=A0ACD0P5Y4_9BASI|nr:hypothetical protein IE53DRAFT_161033 [Violaceomyces palustris]